MVCGRLGYNKGGVVGYVDCIGIKYNAKWGGQMVEMDFQIGYGSDGVDFFYIVGCMKNTKSVMPAGPGISRLGVFIYRRSVKFTKLV